MDMSTMQTVKQGTRQLLTTMNDKVAIASASVSRGETHVSASPRSTRVFGVF